MEVFFNELSIQPANTDAEARQWLETLAELAKALKNVIESLNEDISFKIRINEEFKNRPIFESNTFIEFWRIYIGFDNDLYAFLFGVLDAPYITEEDPQRNNYEYTSLIFNQEEHHLTGLVAAYLKNTLAISFDSNVIWNTCYFAAQINHLDADANLSSSLEKITHASRKQHLIDCHLSNLSSLFNWAAYHPQPSAKGLLPLISVYSLHVESWETFYHNISQLATGERVDEILGMAERIASIHHWVPAKGNLKLRNAHRTIYTIPNSNLIVSIDTQHGEFEVFDQGGNNHLGALSFDALRIKEPDPKRHLNT